MVLERLPSISEDEESVHGLGHLSVGSWDTDDEDDGDGVQIESSSSRKRNKRRKLKKKARKEFFKSKGRQKGNDIKDMEIEIDPLEELKKEGGGGFTTSFDDNEELDLDEIDVDALAEMAAGGTGVFSDTKPKAAENKVLNDTKPEAINIFKKNTKTTTTKSILKKTEEENISLSNEIEKANSRYSNGSVSHHMPDRYEAKPVNNGPVITVTRVRTKPRYNQNQNRDSVNGGNYGQSNISGATKHSTVLHQDMVGKKYYQPVQQQQQQQQWQRQHEQNGFAKKGVNYSGQHSYTPRQQTYAGQQQLGSYLDQRRLNNRKMEYFHEEMSRGSTQSSLEQSSGMRGGGRGSVDGSISALSTVKEEMGCKRYAACYCFLFIVVAAAGGVFCFFYFSQEGSSNAIRDFFNPQKPASDAGSSSMFPSFQPVEEMPSSPGTLPLSTPGTTLAPSLRKTISPTITMTGMPTSAPITSPTSKPTRVPTFSPTNKPTSVSTPSPTIKSTSAPTLLPSASLFIIPSNRPSKKSDDVTGSFDFSIFEEFAPSASPSSEEVV